MSEQLGSLSDTEVIVLSNLGSDGCVNGANEVEGIMCNVSNDMDERI